MEQWKEAWYDTLNYVFLLYSSLCFFASGHGKLLMADGTYYEGEFQNGEIEGHGFKYFASNGNKAALDASDRILIALMKCS